MSSQPSAPPRGGAGGFTLVELLVVISIIALLASMVMFAMAGAQETARRDRTRAQIARVHALLGERWNSYLTRRVPRPVEYGPGMPRPAGDGPKAAAAVRVNAIRDLMRMELPDRKADLTNGRVPGVTSQEPALWFAYQRKIQRLIQRHSGKAVTPEAALAAWSSDNESAECLYLILSQMTDGDKTALAYFSERELGDRDNDGIPEILDRWGNPIKFIRWAPGFGMKDLNNDGEYETLDVAAGYQDRDAPDPFDPRGIFAHPDGNSVARLRYFLWCIPLVPTSSTRSTIPRIWSTARPIRQTIRFWAWVRTRNLVLPSAVGKTPIMTGAITRPTIFTITC